MLPKRTGPGPEQKTRILHDKGFRITEQRRIVLDVISDNGGHLTAEQIHERARRVNPRISLATVYRTLAVLRDTGLIKQRYVSREHDRSHFELATAAEHFHFLCLGCGKIVEFESDAATTQILSELAERPEVKNAARVCVCVEGYCRDCGAKRTVSGP